MLAPSWSWGARGRTSKRLLSVRTAEGPWQVEWLVQVDLQALDQPGCVLTPKLDCIPQKGTRT